MRISLSLKVQLYAVLLLFLGLLPAFSCAESLQVKPALIQQLASDPQWLALLHCSSSDPHSCGSAITSSSFFFASDGDENAEAELQATLEALSINSGNADELPARCRFPARYEWLQEKLKPAGINFPNPQCADLTEWMELLAPKGVTLIFPTSFINNPASAFGHTLLRIDQPDQNEKTRLLAYSANFSANTMGENALEYAFRGVFGGYDGYFSVAPYYQKVTTYSDLENRDIWEYELNFNQAETRILALHLWELRRVAFSYYYFDQNCSFELLSLIEVARPDLKVSRRFPLWVIPADTIKALKDYPGLVSKTVFRPALATKLRAKADASSPEIRRDALRLADNSTPLSFEPLKDKSPAEQAAALDLGYEILTYRRILDRTDIPADRDRAWSLLSRRSSLGVQEVSTVSVPEPVHPEDGHGSARAKISVGRIGGKWYSAYAFRPALHDQLDPAAGYLLGAQIRFFDTELRQKEGESLRLQNFTMLGIESVSPRDDVFHPLSWNVRLQAQRNLSRSGGGSEELTKSLGGGAGFAWKFIGDGLFYSFLDSELERRSDTDPAWALGAGPRIGFFSGTAGRFGFYADTRLIRFEAGEQSTLFRSEIGHRFSLTPQIAITAGMINNSQFSQRESSGFLGFEYFFSPLSLNSL